MYDNYNTATISALEPLDRNSTSTAKRLDIPYI